MPDKKIQPWVRQYTLLKSKSWMGLAGESFGDNGRSVSFTTAAITMFINPFMLTTNMRQVTIFLKLYNVSDYETGRYHGHWYKLLYP
jgi:hypothetical protein